MEITLKEVDKVEITTVIDNCSDLLTMDDSEVMQRAKPIKDMKVGNVVVAEHGFSAYIETYDEDRSHAVLFDFGLSEIATPFNLESLGLDLSKVEALALSHGHIDHFGGLLPVLEMMPGKPLPLVLHPAAFTHPRYLKITEEIKIYFPELDRSALQEAGAEVTESTEPYLLGSGCILFLGEIPKVNDFEKGMPIAYYEKDGEEHWDPLPDDTALVINLKGRGLVVLSGCAHAGIVNTVEYARKITGIDEVFAVIGGFHLTGPAFEPIIGRTVEEIKRFSPQYVVPCHCTGRKAIRAFEEAMPENFIQNLSGTKFIFTGE